MCKFPSEVLVILDVAASVTPHEFHLKSVSILGFFLALSGAEKVPFIPASPGNLEKNAILFFWLYVVPFVISSSLTIKCFPPSYFLGITPRA